MATALAIVGWTLFGVTVLAGILLDLVGLFGNWIILGAVGAAWAFSGFDHFSGWGMLILLGLAIAGEVIETVAASLGASKFGGGKGAAISAMIGCLAGAMLGTPVMPILGTLAGACVGAFVAAAGYESLLAKKNLDEAVKTGIGATLGKIAGLLAKMVVGMFMLFAAALTY